MHSTNWRDAALPDRSLQSLTAPHKNGYLEILWMTDIHLDHINPIKRQESYDVCLTARPDAIFITGDIAIAGEAIPLLQEMLTEVLCPIYFVLGNHDYYGGDIKGVRADVASAFMGCDDIHYLSQSCTYYDLGKGIAVCGVDGVADCRVGSPYKIIDKMSDHRLIEDFNLLKVSPEIMISRRRDWSRLDAKCLKETLDAIEKDGGFDVIYVLTHIPPFVEASPPYRYGTNDGLPYYTNITLGEMLMEWCKEHDDMTIEVLCGHTHLDCEYKPLPNLRIRSLQATYGKPLQCMKMLTI